MSRLLYGITYDVMYSAPLQAHKSYSAPYGPCGMHGETIRAYSSARPSRTRRFPIS